MFRSVPSPTPAQLWQQARVLHLLDRNEDALALVEGLNSDESSAGQVLLLAQILLGIGHPSASDRASQILERLCASDAPTALRVQALIALSNIMRDQQDYDRARTLLLEALELDPTNAAAIRKYGVIEADTDRMPELLDKCRAMLDAGVRAPRLTSTYAMALAGNGAIDEAYKARAGDLMWHGALSCPDGFASIAEFNAALVEELLTHPSLRYENTRRASVNSWRIDELYMSGSKLVKVLLEQFASAVERYVRDVVEAPGRAQDTLFDDVRPDASELSPWAVLTKADGYEDWHIHGSGWISGVYYVTVPEGLPRGYGDNAQDRAEDRAGAIAFGWSERLLGEGSSAKLGEELIHPEPGMLVLFPSHLHHRTWPHGREDDRIAISFDVVPAPSR
ncbi:MAG: putative 2OG-Fe(II) oxygenase [Pseudomonadota bacterium]